MRPLPSSGPHLTRAPRAHLCLCVLLVSLRAPCEQIISYVGLLMPRHAVNTDLFANPNLCFCAYAPPEQRGSTCAEVALSGEVVSAGGHFKKKCAKTLVAAGVCHVTTPIGDVKVEFIATQRASRQEYHLAYKDTHKDEAKQRRDLEENKKKAKESHAKETAKRASEGAARAAAASAHLRTSTPLSEPAEIVSGASRVLRSLEALVRARPAGRGVVVNLFFASPETLSGHKPEAFCSICWANRPTLLPASGSSRRFSLPDARSLGFKEILGDDEGAFLFSTGPQARAVEDETHNFVFSADSGWRSLGTRGLLSPLMFTMCDAPEPRPTPPATPAPPHGSEPDECPCLLPLPRAAGGRAGVAPGTRARARATSASSTRTTCCMSTRRAT